MADVPDPQIVDRIREFNRFYTQRIGVVSQLDGDLSLPAARVLFEVERLDHPAAVDVAQALGMDTGYLSRLVRTLEKRGLVSKRRSTSDGRRQELGLTDAGRQLHGQLTRHAESRVGDMVAPLAPDDRGRLVAAMATVRRLLGDDAPAPCRLREHVPGDLGWVVQRHGVLYARERGFGERFEALVARIVSDFAMDHDPSRERAWIAEQGGERVGSIFLVREDDDVARLRLFLVEPAGRGHGIGSLLLDTLLGFARRKGYARIVLSTVSELDAARRLYERAGFRQLETLPASSDWGPTVTEETWELGLRP